MSVLPQIARYLIADTPLEREHSHKHTWQDLLRSFHSVTVGSSPLALQGSGLQRVGEHAAAGSPLSDLLTGCLPGRQPRSPG